MAITETELAAAIAAAITASKGSGAWLPVGVTGLITSAVAIVSLYWNHRLTRKRDKEILGLKADQEKQDEAERRLIMMRFISSELVFVLEAFALRCHEEMTAPTMEVKVPDTWPKFSLPGISRDWSVLPPDVLHDLQELQVVYRAALQANAYTVEHNLSRILPYVFKAPHATAGLKAVGLATRLRQECGFPESPFAGHLSFVHRELQEQNNETLSIHITSTDYILHPTTALFFRMIRTAPPHPLRPRGNGAAITGNLHDIISH